MQVLFIVDPHFKLDNVRVCEEFISKIVNIIENGSFEFVVIAGDLLHTHERLNIIPLNLVNEFIKKTSKLCETFILVGNHDYCNNGQFLTTNHWMNVLKTNKNVRIIDYPYLHKVNVFEFIFVPYVPNGKFIKALEKLEEGKTYYKKVDCIFAHQEFKHCNLGSNIISNSGDVWNINLPQIVSGHIHKNQQLNNIYYPGSPMQHTFTENEKNIVSILQFDHKDDFKFREIDLKLRKKVTKIIDIKDVKNIIIPINEVNDEYKIILSCDNLKQFKNFKRSKLYEKLSNNNVKISYKPKLKSLNNHQKNCFNFLEIINKTIQENKHLKYIHDSQIKSLLR
jgi:DNA repair exonuclease SbcCD nuclease subunit